MKNEIITAAKGLGIADVGFCSIDEYLKCAEDYPHSSAFSDSGTIPPFAKTAIVCTFSYYNGEKKGNISRYAQGKDYHKVVIEKLEKITRILEAGGYKAEAFTDIGVMNERLLAVLCGIAFIGRNRMAINESCGSYFFIGYVLTDCIIAPDKPNMNSCMGCGMCIKHCPLGALDNGFCEERCLSYITQKKGELREEEKEAMRASNTIWGCDICQEVCPHNKGIPITEIEEFKTNLITNLSLPEGISNKEFAGLYKDRAFSWRGKSVLERNIKIIYK